MFFGKSAKSGKENMKLRLPRMEKQQYLVLLLLGLLVAVVLLPTQKSEGRGETSPMTTELESRLASILSGVEGVGEVQVMLMTKEETGGSGFSQKETREQVTGVLVSATGGDNSLVVQKIQEAVMALFQVEAHKIKVMKKI